MFAILKTILIVLLVYYGLKLLWRLLAPYAMRYIAKKASQKFESAFGQNPFQQQSAKKEGNISVEKTTENTKSSKVVGEYVDFEELD